MTSIAVLANGGHHLDSFHPGLIDRWRQSDWVADRLLDFMNGVLRQALARSAGTGGR